MLAKITFLAAVVLVLALTPYGTTQGLNESCTNPRGESGRCVFLRECQPLLEIYRKADVSFPESEFFYASRCSGQSNGKPLVCCSVAPSLASKVLPRAPADCGRSFSDKIIGGAVAELDEYNWMALLVYIDPNGRKSMNCSASLINSRYVVTAAHCVKIPAEWKLIEVRLGEHNITNNEPDCDLAGCADAPVDVGIERVIVHEEYKVHEVFGIPVNNDIALIRLDRDVGFSDYISPICLPIEDSVRQMDHTAQSVTVAGWGLTEFNRKSDVKLKVNLNVVHHQNCTNTYRRHLELRDTHLCAGGQKDKDSCTDDSGGPLMREIKGNYYMIGIVSFGPKPCGRENAPAVYTNAAMFVDWIQSKLE